MWCYKDRRLLFRTAESERKEGKKKKGRKKRNEEKKEIKEEKRRKIKGGKNGFGTNESSVLLDMVKSEFTLIY